MILYQSTTHHCSGHQPEPGHSVSSEHLKLLWGKQFSKTFLLNKSDHFCVKKKKSICIPELCTHILNVKIASL